MTPNRSLCLGVIPVLRARLVLLASALALLAACQANLSPPRADLTPPSHDSTPYAVCASALARSPSDPWPTPAAQRLPAAIVTNSGEDKVYGLTVDLSNGDLVKVTTLHVAVGPATVVVTPTGDTSYIPSVGSSGSCIQALRVDGLGHVAPLGCLPRADNDWYYKLLVHPTRRLLYSLGSIVRGFHVLADGSLTAISAAISADSLVIHPNGVFAYDSSSVYCIDDDGAPEPVAPLGTALSSSSLGLAAFDANGQYLIVPGSGEIDSYRVESRTGALSLAAVTPLDPGQSYGSLSVATHPTRNLVFAYRTSGLLESYQLESATGRLTRIAQYDAPNASHEVSLHVEPGGRFVFLRRTVNIWEDLSFSSYRVEADGSLTETGGGYLPEDACSTAFFLGPGS